METTKRKLKEYGFKPSKDNIERFENTEWLEIMHAAYPNQKRDNFWMFINALLHMIIITIIGFISVTANLTKNMTFLELLGSNIVYLLFAVVVLMHLLAIMPDEEASYSGFYYTMFFKTNNLLNYKLFDKEPLNHDEVIEVASILRKDNQQLSRLLNDKNHAFAELTYRLFDVLEFISNEELSIALTGEIKDQLIDTNNVEDITSFKYKMLSDKMEINLRQKLIKLYLEMLKMVKKYDNQIINIEYSNPILTRKEYEKLSRGNKIDNVVDNIIHITIQIKTKTEKASN